jgi:hypothetical protein
VAWYEPDGEALAAGARQRVKRHRARRRATVVVTAIVVFAIGASYLWLAFDTTRAPREGGPSPSPVPIGTRIDVAKGVDAVRGPWHLWVTVTANGVSNHLVFDTQNGGGGGCCASGPLGHPMVSDGLLNPGGGPFCVLAWVTPAVDRVVFAADTGERVDATIYPIPGEPDGLTHVALVMFDARGDGYGHLIAYDDAGRTLDETVIGRGLTTVPGRHPRSTASGRSWTRRYGRSSLSVGTTSVGVMRSRFDRYAAPSARSAGTTRRSRRRTR